MPVWVTSAHAETIEDVAFLSEAALNHLHIVLSREDLPQALMQDRLALVVAEACVALSGRSERVAALRDTPHLLRPIDRRGPAGETVLACRRAVKRPLSIKSLSRARPDIPSDRTAHWLDVAQGAPVDRAATVLKRVLTATPRAEASAVFLADVTLGLSPGWGHLVPLIAMWPQRADLRKLRVDPQGSVAQIG